MQPGESTARRVAIVFWDGHLSVAPSLLSAISGLAEAGFEVDVFIRDWGTILPPVGPMPEGVRIIRNRLVRWLSFPSAGRITTNRIGVLLGLPVFLVSALNQARKRRYLAIFGVDPLGGYCGLLMTKVHHAPFYYWSLEILAAPQTLRDRILTRLQRRACRAASRILIQDSRRGEALLDGDIALQARILLVPNGASGPPVRTHSDFLSKKLGILNTFKIVLHAGMLDDCVLSFELAESVRDWPSAYCLVLHTNQRFLADSPPIPRIRALGEPRVFLSLDPVPANELDEVIGSATIGLATYDGNLGPNYALIAAASGKLATYLRSGVPVICTDQTGIRDLMSRYGCGVVVDSLSEIPAALERISGDYESFRAGAIECYLREYEFSAHFRAVLEALAG